MSQSTSNPILLQANSQEAHLYLAGRSQLDNWKVTRSSTIEAENYTIRELIDNIKLELLAAFPTCLIKLGFNFNKQRVDLTSSVKICLCFFCRMLYSPNYGIWKTIKNRFIYHGS